MKIRLLFFYWLFFHLQIIGQKEEAKSHIHNLASDSMCGRGYVNDGHIIAAKYLANEFKRFGLNPMIQNNFFQEFKINVNTFPSKIEVALNDNFLNPGKDFMLESQSGSAYGNYKLFNLNANKLFLEKSLDFPTKTAIVLDVSGIENIDSISILEEMKYLISKSFPVIWLTNNKFNWSVSSVELPYPVIQMRPNELKNHKEIWLNINNKFIDNLVTQNVVGGIKGRRDKYVVVSAHYDHLGMMGDVIFPGANDNASGIAMLLSLAKNYAKKKPKYNMLFIGFGAEEVGVIGSYNFVNNPPIDMRKIKLVINLDIVGTGSEGIAIVNAKEQGEKLKKLISINNHNKFFNKVKIRGQALNSDHYWFSQKGVPAVFIYTLGGIKAYHDIYDIYETLPLDKYNELYTLLIKFIKKL